MAEHNHHPKPEQHAGQQRPGENVEWEGTEPGRVRQGPEAMPRQETQQQGGSQGTPPQSPFGQQAFAARQESQGQPPLQEYVQQVVQRPWQKMCRCMREYAVEHPESAAMWCFAAGFILGWKLKPRWLS